MTGKKAIIIACCIVCALCLGYGFWFAGNFADNFLAPLFLDSYIERLPERGLPKAIVESGGVVYCRMKADDFRFPLPPGSHAVLPITVTGGFDALDGTVLARMEGSNQISPEKYQSWLSDKIQIGGYITSELASNGLLIKFHYFGDK